MSGTTAMGKAVIKLSHEEKINREVVTPEGAVIHLRIADAAERAAALLIDAAIMLATLIVFVLCMAFADIGLDGDLLNIIFVLFFFLLRGFYFTFFEMGRRAATPGKRIMKLRVVAREGRQLTANAIFARNVMRELEVFMPFSVLLSGPGQTGFGALMTTCLLLWLGVFVLLPIFNRDKLRAGDIVAGTWVVRNPKLELGTDISKDAREHQDDFHFTDEQLSTYGEHELQVLEDVLRSGTPDVLKAVATRIQKRINWIPAPKEKHRDFLEAFYKALRQTLETRMLFGNRKKDKFDTGA